jgi:hypothetical protein
MGFAAPLAFSTGWKNIIYRSIQYIPLAMFRFLASTIFILANFNLHW